MGLLLKGGGKKRWRYERGGDGREGRGESGEEREGCPVFPWADLSTLSTTHALVGWCSDAVLQWLESKCWLWIHKPEYNGTGTASQITFAISTCILDNFAERRKRIGLMESAAHSDLYFSALTINLLTYLYTLQKKQLKQYIISCKTVEDALKITVLNTKTSSAAGGFAPWPPPGALPLDPHWGSAPRPPL